MYGIIYKATSPIGNVYIGQTTMTLAEKQKFLETLILIKVSKKKRPYPFYIALLEYGFASFQWDSIDTAKNQSELDRKEKHWIVHYNSADPAYGYNGTWGGKDGIPNKEACRKMSEAGKKKRLTKEHRRNMGLAMARLDPQIVIAIREHLQNGGSLRGTAKKFHIGKTTICDIKSRRRYAWV